uniref:Secreted antigen 1 n=1 Tax=Babesia ovis TaxID=5869 RepID=A0A0C5GWE2_BABOV|nr:secreted antigen 1 [Babesia ovis]
MEGFVSNKKVTKLILGIAAVAGATGGSVLAEKHTKHVDFHHLGGDEDIGDVPFESEAVIKPVAEIRNHGVDFLENGVGDEISFNPVDNFRGPLDEIVDVGDEISFNPIENFRNGYEETVDVGDEISFNPVDNFRNGYVETVDVGDEISFNPIENFRNRHDELVSEAKHDMPDYVDTVDNFRNGYVETVDVGDEISFNPVDNFRNRFDYDDVDAVEPGDIVFPESTSDNVPPIPSGPRFRVDNNHASRVNPAHVRAYFKSNGFEADMKNGKENYKMILDGVHEYFVENKSLHQYVPLLETVINSADINLPDAIIRFLGCRNPSYMDTTYTVYIANRIARLMVNVLVPQRPNTFKGRMARLDLMHMFFTLIMEAMTSKYN